MIALLAGTIFMFHVVMYNIIKRPLEESVENKGPILWVREYPEEKEAFSRGDIVTVDVANYYARSGSHWRPFQLTQDYQDGVEADAESDETE